MDYEYADDSVFLYLLNSQESDADVANAYPNLPNATFFCRVPINSIILGLQIIIRTYKKVGFGRLRQGFKAEASRARVRGLRFASLGLGTRVEAWDEA